MEPRKNFIFVIGSPGAGKGTLCGMLAREYGLHHVSVGDSLRQAVQSPTADPVIVDHVRHSKLLPTEILFTVLKPHLLSGADNLPVLVDGFPRRLDQATAFEKEFGEPQLVLFFDCPQALAKDRVVTRRVGRDGDNADIFDKRYDEFCRLTPPITGYFESQGKLITIDTSGASEVSYDTLRNKLKTKVDWV